MFIFEFDKKLSDMEERLSAKIDNLGSEYQSIIVEKDKEIASYKDIISHYEEAYYLLRKITENQEKVAYYNNDLLASLKIIVERIEKNVR